jgi:hypothetical protein
LLEQARLGHDREIGRMPGRDAGQDPLLEQAVALVGDLDAGAVLERLVRGLLGGVLRRHDAGVDPDGAAGEVTELPVRRTVEACRGRRRRRVILSPVAAGRQAEDEAGADDAGQHRAGVPEHTAPGADPTIDRL